MDKETETNQVIFDVSKVWSSDQNKDFSINKEIQERWLVNIDDVLILQTNNNSSSIIDTSIYNTDSEPSNNISKFKIIWAWAWVILLIFITGILIYMMYPVEFENLWKTMQWDVIASQTWSSWTTNNLLANNQNSLPSSDIDTSWKQAIDNLFKWSWSNTNQSDNNTNINNTQDTNNQDTNVDDPSKLIQNPDWSSWLSDNSTLLEGLDSGANYWNWDEQSQIQLLSQIRAKIEVAKLDYKQAKDLWNIKAMKLIAWANIKYQDLLTKVENNEIVVKSEIQNQLVEIQSTMDEAKILTQ